MFVSSLTLVLPSTPPRVRFIVGVAWAMVNPNEGVRFWLSSESFAYERQEWLPAGMMSERLYTLPVKFETVKLTSVPLLFTSMKTRLIVPRSFQVMLNLLTYEGENVAGVSFQGALHAGGVASASVVKLYSMLWLVLPLGSVLFTT